MMSKFTVLVIDDDEIDRENITRIFKKSNFDVSVFACANGAEAFEFVDNYTSADPLLLLLDISMPIMNGLEFLETLRKNSKRPLVPTVILTSSNTSKDKEKAYSLGISGYIVKPIDAANFNEAINIFARYWNLCELPREGLHE